MLSRVFEREHSLRHEVAESSRSGNWSKTKVTVFVRWITSRNCDSGWNVGWSTSLRCRRFAVQSLALVLLLILQGFGAAGGFVVFPKAGRLISPDKRYEVRDVGPPGSGSDFVGNFHSLWLTESGTGRARKLCDYLGAAAVAWTDDDALLITEYVGKKTSRALLFAPVTTEQAIMIDASGLLRAIEPQFRETLRGNDHVFVEAARLDKNIFYFRVWGYGQQSPKGFKWNCRYNLGDGTLGCNVDR